MHITAFWTAQSGDGIRQQLFFHQLVLMKCLAISWYRWLLTIMFSSADLASQQLRNTGTNMFLHGGQKIWEQQETFQINNVYDNWHINIFFINI